MFAVSAFAAVGLLVGLLVAMIIIKFANKDKKIKTQYDERQQNILNKGYKYGFYTMITCEAILICLGIGQVSLPFADYLLHFIAILAGCLVLCVYSIWNDAYWGMNNNKKSYLIIFAVLFVINLIPIVAGFLNGSIKAEGVGSLPITNIIVVIWMALIGCTLLVKKIADSREEED
ncbi:hypothetical protein [Butyrivibrio sp. MC2021]|jgi:predicted histidine transporter YuiF (NhaC family)|uniref:hypothetical protein n=1 Tax=Butyrivibrio sp. MC2021 TaxID=1408306 RepID=UPI000684CA83|nr:hypothetical protein [Butyrivibrio sp. MC2021]